MTNILTPTKEQSEKTAYWEKYIKEHPDGGDEEDLLTL